MRWIHAPRAACRVAHGGIATLVTSIVVISRRVRGPFRKRARVNSAVLASHAAVAVVVSV